MSNELIKSLVGSQCNIATGSFGTAFNNVKVTEVIDNWVKIVNKKGEFNLINADYITHIKLTDK